MCFLSMIYVYIYNFMTLLKWSKSTFYHYWKMVVVVGHDVRCFITEQQLLRKQWTMHVFFLSKYLNGSEWCWYITLSIAMKQQYIILYI